MMWLLRRGKKGVVHRAVKEGGGGMVIMMTSCGLHVRWDLPHEGWERAEVATQGLNTHVTCRRCLR